MKVLALIVLALGSASARGSGPYLPSGWRPDGPAFYLPTKQTPAEDPLKDLILQGSEASGSDALREYGPPKFLVSQDLIKQSLPDEVIEITFANQQQIDENVEAQDETVTEVQATTLEAEVPIEVVEVITESQTTINAIDFDTVDVTQTTSYDTQEHSDSTQDSDGSASLQNERQEMNVLTQTESNDESNNLSALKVELEQTFEQEVQNIAQTAEEVVHKIEEVKNIEGNVQNVEQNVEQKVQNVEQVVQNIPDILAYVNNEITQQVELSSGQADVSSFQEVSRSLEQAPEGFLEYGPPGFKEYGPPKVDELAIGSFEGLISEADSFQNTDVARRRRFSPKFRPAKIH